MNDLDALHANSLTVPCRHCGAIVGEVCRNKTTDGNLPTRIPHPSRLNDTEEVPF